ncbi:MAG: FMN-binding protein [Desulfosarcina sp.]|nr:FMN-binding protein [Desulfobacterales bacterium]
MTEKGNPNFISQAWLVLVLALCFGGLLAGIQITLGPTIEANKLNETLERVPELVFGAAHAEELSQSGLEINSLSVGVEKAGRTVRYSVFETKSDGHLAGWVTKTTGQGYADKIEILIGFDPRVEKITGLFVLDQKETPGLGNKIIENAWRSQFVDKSTSQPLAPVKGQSAAPNEIDAITGATISSRAVTNIINTTVADLRQPLAAKAKGQ